MLARFEANGLTFSPDASRQALIRRACFDLTGLPPNPQRVRQFMADVRPDAYERLIDELLSSPQYGERWGRHWLDVVGYVDTADKDFEPDKAQSFRKVIGDIATMSLRGPTRIPRGISF